MTTRGSGRAWAGAATMTLVNATTSAGLDVRAVLLLNTLLLALLGLYSQPLAQLCNRVFGLG